MRSNAIVGLIVLFVLTPTTLAQPAAADADRAAAALRDVYLAKYKPLWLESAAAWWEANITGADAAYARKKAADRALVDLHSDHETFARLNELRVQGQVSDPVLRRELDVMHRTFLPGQVDPTLQKRIVELENDVEQIFNTYRSPVGGKSLSENEVRDILANSTVSADAEAAWKAYMDVGRVAESKLRELIELRNRTAHELGFPNYYSMQMVLQEVDEAELIKLFDELDELTRAPFAEVKTALNAARAARFHVPASELRPWHFGDLFFQEAPESAEVSLDAVFKDADLLALARKYYTSIGLPVENILARSDLYEKPGKCPHAFSHDLDRAGTVCILTNLKPNVYWADTLLHELGHAVYDLGIDPNVPFLLRMAASGITTEGIAEMLGAFIKNEEWLHDVRGLDTAEAARVGRAGRESLRTGRLMFSRWAQVMVRFERGMYADPSQDLAKLWWDLKLRYQLLSPPDRTDRPDYAAKVHVLTTPAYYHSYMLGELFAAQVRAYVAREVLKDPAAVTTSFFDKPAAGTYLRQRIFGPGSLYSWNDLTKRATGEALTPKYFAADLAR